MPKKKTVRKRKKMKKSARSRKTTHLKKKASKRKPVRRKKPGNRVSVVEMVAVDVAGGAETSMEAEEPGLSPELSTEETSLL